jgi:hypothetical protein
MKTTGYIVWVNDRSFWHRSRQEAEKRAYRAHDRGQDTLIFGIDSRLVMYPLTSLPSPAGPGLYKKAIG